MNQIITEDTLAQAGIDLSEKDVSALLGHLNTTLEERVGTEITASLNDAQLKELLEVQDSGGDEAVAEWMTKNVPELAEITQDEIDILLGELANNAEGINTAG